MRKILAAILAAVLLLQTGLLVNEPQKAYAATAKADKVIRALDIMKTDKGEIGADTDEITRAQFAQLLVNLSTQKDSIARTSNISLFKDVSQKHWAASYIKTAVTNGWMSGYINGSFKPDSGVTLIEAVSGVLKLLGYSDSDFSGNITGGKLALYQSKKLNKNITVTLSYSYLNYSNCVNLFYNVLNGTTKDGMNYATVLGYTLDAAGEVDYLSLVNTGTQGPIIADNSWSSEIPFSIETATFYKNDIKCNYTDIDKYDVLYYSESFETVWAYDTKITGTLTGVNPDLINPTSVTVAGTEYQFENSTASTEFSSVGSIQRGDVITLLLGKNGEVAGVLSLDEYNTRITGLVLNVGTHLVKDNKGDYINTSYVDFVDAEGNRYTQDYDSTVFNFNEEDLIRITYENGVAAVSEYSMPGFSFEDATVSSDAKTFGSMKFASNVHILDYHEGTYIKVYPTRLANMVIMNRMIRYYATDVSGQITDLILNNVTGDMDSYGIYTGYTYGGGSGVYHYLLDGKEGAFTTANFTDLTPTEGPAGFVIQDGSIASSYSLTGTPVSSVGNTTITSGAVKYPLADKVSVYYLSNGKYAATSINNIDLSKQRVTAYYDKAITLGGRIRVIVAESTN